MKKLYVNLDTQQFVDVIGKVVTRQFSIDFATETQLSFQFLDAEHEVVDIEAGDYYLAANNHLNDYDTCCFLSRDYVIEANVITFTVDTFNENFKRKVKNRDTKLFLELGFKAENSNSYLRLFANEILAQPRVFVDGIAPPPITLYYTQNEVDILMSELESTIYEQQVNVNSSQEQQSPFIIDLGGEAIQVYSTTEAVSGSLTIEQIGFLNSEASNSSSNVATVEVFIPASGDISTIIIPSNVFFVDAPESLVFEEGYSITYHVFTARFMQIETEECYKLNYCYSFGINKIED